ncbi:MAG TPA: cytochrome c oxidase subunit 3 family protein [Rubricoccaceae bacterium]|jgi:cytochrome c oxidase subunit 3
MATPTLTVDDPHTAAHGEAAHGGDGHHGDLMLVGHDGNLHPAHLQHHFVSAEQQFDASKLGMWLFLSTEILLFGGMFVAYGIYRVQYPELYEQASLQLDTVLGALNTLVLLTSSLTMAWAIRGAQMDNQKVLIRNLIATVVLASGFLVVKYFEYEHKFHLGIFPGYNFELNEDVQTVSQLGGSQALKPRVILEEDPVSSADAPTDASGDTAPAPGETVGETDAEDVASVGERGSPEASHEIGEGEAAGHGREGQIFDNRRAGIFFSIYYMMTGIHAIHILIGIVAISILAWKARKGKYTSVWYTPVENVGLYWHVVDIIWIFVFPLMYLI